MRITIKQSYIQMGIIALLVFLFCITLMTFWYQAKIYTEVIIAEDIESLAAIFKKINDECGILGFKYQKGNYIDFLNVISFEGSELGTMTLQHPAKWKGPYLRDNPTVQGKFYEIVKVNSQHYIVPGQGVKLKNGVVIGKDVIFDDKNDIERMLKDSQKLNFQGKPLAARITTHQETPRIALDEFLDED